MSDEAAPAPAPASPAPAPATPAPTLDQQVESQHAKVEALSGMKGPEYREALDALEKLYGQQAVAQGKAPAPAPDPTNTDAVEAHAFAREYPLAGVDPDSGEPLSWDHGSRRVLQRLADQHGVRNLVDQAYALATVDGAKPTPPAAQWEGELRRQWGTSFDERYEAMQTALDKIEDTDPAAMAKVDRAARRSPRIADILAEIGAKLAAKA